MTEKETSNVNIAGERVIATPRQLKSLLPLPSEVESLVLSSREQLRSILAGRDNRIFIVVGPCSIHDPVAALEYADRLAVLAEKVRDQIVLVMRTYFEKPRTSTGWKGFINDPNLNDSFQVEEGLKAARKLLIDIGKRGVAVGTEALDPVVPQYLDDLISWYAIGARTTESQTHREMASGLSAPVGFKNGTDGSIEVAINALKSVSTGHHFLGINQDGQCAVMQTSGNTYAHIVLRGGNGQPNYDSVHVSRCDKLLRDAHLSAKIVIDCSHGNSMKDFSLQPIVFNDCIHQVVDGNRSIVGLMLESHLHEGTQTIPRNIKDLAYGVSVTDACISWQVTEEIILKAAQQLALSS
jgi:3-deoxy-7-phosphoheptulonate synthase